MEEFNFSDSDSSLNEAYDDYLLMQDPELEQILHEYGDDLDHLGQEYLHRHPVLPRRINPEILPLIQEKEQLGGGSAQVGGALFRFRLGAILDHRSEHMGVHEQVVPVHLTQNQRADPADHVLAEELSQSLMNSVQELLRRYDRRGNPLEGRDRLYFSIGSQYLTSVYDDWNLTANEWRHPDQQPRFACVLENLAMMLNSNESFRMDRSFTLSLVVVRAPPQGGGKKRRRIYPGVASAFSLPRLKRSILQVPRDDRNMCCAKALWLAYQHKQLDEITFNNRYRRSFRNKPAFRRQACELQESLGIPPGTVCGPEQLEIFANYFQGLGYYILVIESSRAYQGFRYGEGHDPEKALSLYYHDHHYDTMTIIQGFFVSNHYCFKCQRPYQNEGSHRCEANKDHCSACYQDGGEDFLRYRQTHHLIHDECNGCHCLFYGPTCYQQHRQKTYRGRAADATHLPICKTVQCCRHCGKRSVYHIRDRLQPVHKCYHHECPSCEDIVDLSKH